jgi:hypothetical protein
MNLFCCGNVIENHALGKSFYVCTKCKKEVFPMPSTTPNVEVGSVTYNTYPTTPTPISVEFVDKAQDFEQLELFDFPWIDGSDLSIKINPTERKK